MAGIFYEDESDLDEGVAGAGDLLLDPAGVKPITREQAVADATAVLKERMRQEALARNAAGPGAAAAGPPLALITVGVVAIGIIALQLRKS